MPIYTTTTKLGYWMPSSLPAAITDAVKNAAIADAGAEIDAWLPKIGLSYKNGTQKFPDVTDSPATPTIIDTCAQWIAAYNIYVILKEINRDPENKIGEILKGKADRRLERINKGEMEVILSDGTKITFSDTGIYHTKKYVEPRIRKSQFDALGAALDSYPGSLSDFDGFEKYLGVHGGSAAAGSDIELPQNCRFVNQTTFTITHTLGYAPDVWVLDTDGNAITCEINYASDNKSFTLTFSEAQSGTVYWQ